ncbi:carbohydrate ABC transporter permease [Paraburkholderia atlantica]|uniref:Binding-protein-dependent transport systems inner membrane component n=1 Tax=Paraburkholderia atlantica TaxID=2654982 RepID=D5WK37_PARAM|nr:sugar ABC transporter permease [Paraburkholderia atlantica]ADG19583.1 binding-protein-dependent transport systems inner membrane component [Paraburkholderia atlantica]MBB5509163.1 multiple sugar transport system permease protein [Paraburkholderia atlantica]
MSTPLLPAASWVSQQRRAFLLGLTPSLIALAAVTLVPTVVLIVVSLTPLSLTNPAASFRFDDPLVNYRQLLHDTRFLDSVRTQLKLSVASVTSQLAIGLGLALLLDGKSAFLRGVRTVFLIPMVLPPIVAALIWKILYSPDISPLHRALESAGYPVSSLIANPSTALWAVAAADTWQWFPFTMLMVLATLQTIPDDPLEAASLDGAGRWQLFRYIVLPYLRPVLVVCGLFRLIDSFKAFPLIYVLTNGGPGTVTEVTNYYSFIEAFNFSYWGYGSAIATVILVGVFLLSWLVGKLGWNSHDAD